MLEMLSPEDASLLLLGGLAVGAVVVVGYLVVEYLHRFSVWMNEE